MMKDVLAVVLAGGKGSRLEPLTRDRAKPAVPFGGNYRIVDFSLSNCLNSGIRQMLILTQYKAMSLDRHINLAWRPYFCRELGEFIDVVPPQQRIDENWYQGTADAVYQNIYAIEKERPEYVVILAGDHIYKMNYQRMLKFHQEVNADLTIGALKVDKKAAKEFGVMQVDSSQRVVGFEEKSPSPKTLPNEPDHCLATMGIYIFSARFLFEELCRDATDLQSRHDFGRDIIPNNISKQNVFAFPFQDENQKQSAYWRDVGTLDAYYEANMDLVAVDPMLNLYSEHWPVRTFQPNVPAAKFVFGSRGATDRVGHAQDSIVCSGSVISGGQVERSIIAAHTRVNSYAHVEDSILFSHVTVGRHARIRRAIVDKGVSIPAGCQIGFDLELDRQRGFTISDGGVVVIAKGSVISGTKSVGSPHFAKTENRVSQ